MISGVVSANREATVRLTLHGRGNQERELEFVIDTGFNGWITLPSSLISELGLPWRRRGLPELADGSHSIFDVYEAIINWDGESRTIWADEINAAPMAGMSLLANCELKIQVWDGGDVTIAARS
jgi:clan AA aspartic protease